MTHINARRAAPRIVRCWFFWFTAMALVLPHAFGLTYTNSPNLSWRYSELIVNGPNATTYFASTINEYASAGFKGYVTYADSPADGPLITDLSGNTGYQIFSTWIRSTNTQTLNLVFNGDDGHSLFVDGQFASGGGYAVVASNTIALAANVSRKLEFVIYNSLGGWGGYLGLGPWTGYTESNWSRLMENTPGLSMNADGFSQESVAPMISQILPDSGSTAGGTLVNIAGTNFTTNSSVRFGTNSATSLSFVSGTNLVAVTPASNPGLVDVTVENPDAQRSVLTNGFRFIDPIASTNTSFGTVHSDEVWSGTIELTGDVVIPAGVTVTVQAGTQIKVSPASDRTVSGLDPGYTELVVEGGTLLVQGTADNPVHFESAGELPKSGDWYGIVLKAGTASLAHCEVRHARHGVQVIAGSDYAFNDVLFADATQHGAYLPSSGAYRFEDCRFLRNGSQGVQSDGAKLIGLRCLFSANGGYGANIGGAVQLEDCEFSSNTYSGLYAVAGGGILRGNFHDNAYNGAVLYYGTYTVVDTHAATNGGDGISCSGVLQMNHCRLEANGGSGLAGDRSAPSTVVVNNTSTLRNKSYGVAVTELTATDCDSSNNSQHGFNANNVRLDHCTALGNQVGVWGYSVTVRNSTIQNNTDTGIYWNTALLEGGIAGNDIRGNAVGLEYGGSANVADGLIVGDDVVGNTDYEIKISGVGTVVVRGCNLGPVTAAELASGAINLSRIFDHADDTSKGTAQILDSKPVSALTYTNSPNFSWRYSELILTAPKDATYFATATNEYSSARFKGHVTYADSPADGPVITDLYGNTGYQIFSTWIRSTNTQSLDVVFNGDDGHSLFVDGQFAAGGGYGVVASNTIDLTANLPRKLELVIYNSLGGWGGYLGLGPWTGYTESNWSRLLENTPGLSQNADGFSETSNTPSISQIIPNSGSIAGGTLVKISGAGFLTNSLVFFGSNAAVTVTASSGTNLIVTTPAYSAGVVDVIVHNPDGQEAVATNAFRFSPPSPPVENLVQNGSFESPLVSGPYLYYYQGDSFAGGWSVEQEANAFAIMNASDAYILSLFDPTPVGNQFAYSGNWNSIIRQDLAVPLGVGASYNLSFLLSGFRSPSGTVTISISPSGNTNEVFNASFSSVAATWSRVQTNFSVPADGFYSLVLHCVGGGIVGLDDVSILPAYTNTSPTTIVSISPVAGPTSGGTRVSITGTGFATNSVVTFGTNLAASVNFAGPTNLVATTPPLLVGVFDVTVNTPGALGATLLNAYTVLTSPSTNCIPPAEGLVSWWPLDRDAHDLVGTNNGVVVGDALFVAGEVGKALYFSGGHVEIANSASLNPTTEISIEAWVKPVSYSGLGSDAILEKSYPTHVPPYYQYHLGMTGDLRGGADFDAAFSISGQYVTVNTPAGYWTAGQWYHVVATFDGSTVKLYANGSLLDETPAPGKLDTYDTPLWFGGHPNTSGRTPVTFDEVAIYNRALTVGEVAAIYAAGSAGRCAVAPPAPPPIISSIFPTNGSSAGGTSVRIAGTGFETNSIVRFGTNAATSVTFVSSTNLVAITLASNPSLVDVTVENEDGQDASLTNAFRFLGPSGPAENLVHNGSFEIPKLESPFYASVDPGSWTGGYQMYNNSAGLVPAQDGVQYVSITASGGSPLSQVFSAFRSGSFQLSWNDSTSGSANYQIEVSPANSAIPAFSATFYPTSGIWSNRMARVPLVPGNYVLTFTGMEPIGRGVTFIDNVSITAEDGSFPTNAPSILTQPHSQDVRVGANLVVAVDAIGAPPLRFQWQLNGTNLHDTARIQGSTSNSLSLTSVRSDQAGDLRVLIANDYGTITSSIVSLSITNSSSNEANLIKNGSFESPLLDEPYYARVDPPSWMGGFQLVNNNNSVGLVPAQEGFQYEEVTSTVLSPLSQPFSVPTSGQYELSWYDYTTRGGVYLVSIIEASSGSNQFTNSFFPMLSWAKQSSHVDLYAGNYILTFAGIEPTGALPSFIDNVSCVQVGGLPPAITNMPQSQTVAGDKAAFTVGARGTEPLAYQWRFKGAKLTDGARISGTTSSVLQITGLAVSDLGNYDVVVSNQYGSVTSGMATLDYEIRKTGIPLQAATASASRTPDYPPSAAIDGVLSGDAGWALPDGGSSAAIVFQTLTDAGFEGGTLLTFTLNQGRSQAVFPNYRLGQFRLSVTTADRSTFADRLANGGNTGTNWITLNPLAASASDGGLATILNDSSILCAANTNGPNGVDLTYTVTALTTLSNITGLRLEALTNRALPRNGPGLANNGNFVLQEFRVDEQPVVAGPPSIVTQPLSSSPVSSTNNRYSIMVAGQGPFTYRWQLNGVDLAEGGQFSGASSNVLSISPNFPGLQGLCQVIVSGRYGSVTSAPVVIDSRLPLKLLPTTISLRPSEGSFALDYHLTTNNGVLYVVAASSPVSLISTGTVLWTLFPSNSTSGSVSLTNFDNPTNGFFTLLHYANALEGINMPMDGSESTASNDFYLYAQGLPKVWLSDQPQSITIRINDALNQPKRTNGTLSFYLVASDGREVTYPYNITPSPITVIDGMASGSIVIHSTVALEGESLAAAFTPEGAAPPTVAGAAASAAKPLLESGCVPIHVYQDIDPNYWIHPLKSAYGISSTYGEWSGAGDVHWGIDFAAPANTPVYAAKRGVVSHVGTLEANGYLQAIVVNHGNGFATRYLHTLPFVREGQVVEAGSKLGVVGDPFITGVSPAHLHFEIRKVAGGSGSDCSYTHESAPGEPVNPMMFDTKFTPFLTESDKSLPDIGAIYVAKENPATKAYSLLDDAYDNPFSMPEEGITKAYVIVQCFDAEAGVTVPDVISFVPNITGITTGGFLENDGNVQTLDFRSNRDVVEGFIHDAKKPGYAAYTPDEMRLSMQTRPKYKFWFEWDTTARPGDKAGPRTNLVAIFDSAGRDWKQGDYWDLWKQFRVDPFGNPDPFKGMGFAFAYGPELTNVHRVCAYPPDLSTCIHMDVYFPDSKIGAVAAPADLYEFDLVPHLGAYGLKHTSRFINNDRYDLELISAQFPNSAVFGINGKTNYLTPVYHTSFGRFPIQFWIKHGVDPTNIKVRARSRLLPNLFDEKQVPPPSDYIVSSTTSASSVFTDNPWGCHEILEGAPQSTDTGVAKTSSTSIDTLRDLDPSDGFVKQNVKHRASAQAVASPGKLQVAAEAFAEDLLGGIHRCQGIIVQGKASTSLTLKDLVIGGPDTPSHSIPASLNLTFVSGGITGASTANGPLQQPYVPYRGVAPPIPSPNPVAPVAKISISLGVAVSGGWLHFSSAGTWNYGWNDVSHTTTASGPMAATVADIGSGQTTFNLPLGSVPLNTPIQITLTLAADASVTYTYPPISGEADSGFKNTFGFPENGSSVFDLPAGYTANAISVRIIDNKFTATP